MKTLPHDHGQKFEQMCEQIPGLWRIYLNKWEI